MTVQGYYSGGQYIALEDVSVRENQRVQITILDDYIEVNSEKENAELLARYKGCGGRLWKEDPQEYVSALRAEDRV